MISQIEDNHVTASKLQCMIEVNCDTAITAKALENRAAQQGYKNLLCGTSGNVLIATVDIAVTSLKSLKEWIERTFDHSGINDICLRSTEESPVVKKMF